MEIPWFGRPPIPCSNKSMVFLSTSIDMNNVFRLENGTLEIVRSVAILAALNEIPNRLKAFLNIL